MLENTEAEQEELALLGAVSVEEKDPNELDTVSDEGIEFFYLDSSKEQVFEIYKLARLYQTAADNLDPTLVQMLCNKRELDLEETLTDLALIHYGVWKENEKARKRETKDNTEE